MVAVFVGLRLSALGMKCEVGFLLVGHTLLTLCRVFYLEDLLPGCWGDQGSCELVLRRTNYIAEHAGLSTKPFQSNF